MLVGVTCLCTFKISHSSVPLGVLSPFLGGGGRLLVEVTCLFTILLTLFPVTLGVLLLLFIVPMF